MDCSVDRTIDCLEISLFLCLVFRNGPILFSGTLVSSFVCRWMTCSVDISIDCLELSLFLCLVFRNGAVLFSATPVSSFICQCLIVCSVLPSVRWLDVIQGLRGSLSKFARFVFLVNMIDKILNSATRHTINDSICFDI
uniref:Uncharacterized protein n=1 Tax=Cacopsylla melanoneura TaxID=428564 RepID=A0A8D8SWT8_9HEMI